MCDGDDSQSLPPHTAAPETAEMSPRFLVATILNQVNKIDVHLIIVLWVLLKSAYDFLLTDRLKYTQRSPGSRGGRQ